MPSLKVVIPTRDSARWIGTFLNAYRRLGVEPIYIVDTRSEDATLNILRDMLAVLIPFTPSGPFAEAGMVEFGSRQAGAEWVLRLDDDEFRRRHYCAGFPLSGSGRLIRPGIFRDANYSFTKARFSIAAVPDVSDIRRRPNISTRRGGFITSSASNTSTVSIQRALKARDIFH